MGVCPLPPAPGAWSPPIPHLSLQGAGITQLAAQLAVHRSCKLQLHHLVASRAGNVRDARLLLLVLEWGESQQVSENQAE